MTQAIITKFLPATNHRGSRLKVTAYAGSITIPWDHALDVYENHNRAAKAFAIKFKWFGCWYVGSMPDDSGYCYVLGNLVPGPAERAFAFILNPAECQ